ncbi:MAG: VIT family protein [Ilumatobacteraceae bacterium]|nr:VIT family protein [Ilumatobacteraceae bacterium]MBP7889854.1 VIT family protein [Ilumatobacteraceae bacterium]MBP8209363.1 VIT family protein [Ilumatobacteraceae bacterium]
MRHSEGHYGHRVGWLRAMVLGANDGIISTAALLLGVAAANSTRTAILTAGMAGLVAGAVSMALGEYVSVSSQRDSERSDIEKEKWELANQADHELEELTAIYRSKGLPQELAKEVAVQLTEHDALATHLLDELGISQDELAKPFQAAWSSALSFSVGASIPLVATALASASWRIATIIAVTMVALVGLGYIGARAGGAGPGRSIARVVIGGAIAMGVTMAVGWAFGAAVA